MIATKSEHHLAAAFLRVEGIVQNERRASPRIFRYCKLQSVESVIASPGIRDRRSLNSVTDE